MGCMWCGGAGDDFDSPAYGYCAVQSARDQAGIDYAAMGMPSQTQLLAASTNGAITPLTTPVTTPYVIAGMGGLGQTTANQAGSTTRNLAKSTDQPTPTALTVSQSFQSGVPCHTQPGVVNLDPNQTANGLSWTKGVPMPSDLCPVTNWVNTTNPWMLAGATFAIMYLANMHVQKTRARRAAAK